MLLPEIAVSLLLSCLVWVPQESQQQSLPVLEGPAQVAINKDWLVSPINRPARVFQNEDGRELVLDNGLVRRRWRIEPNLACIAFDDLVARRSMVRAVRPEARVKIDGFSYDVGGLIGQPNHAYLSPQFLDSMTGDPAAMQFKGYEIGPIEPRLEWKQRRHHSPDVSWPPPGVTLRFDFEMPANQRPQHPAVTVSVHYELYDGIPLVSKWLTIQNHSPQSLLLDQFTVEELALVEHSNWVEFREGVDLPRPDYLHVETDFAFGGFNAENANRHVIHWQTDPKYTSQVNWAKQTPCLLNVRPTYGPAQEIKPGAVFESFRTFELVYGNSDRERKGLAVRRMYRTIAPWVTENPITHHLLSNDWEEVRTAIDQAAQVGFEAIILSFGSGFNMENRDPDFLRRWKEVADEADEKNIELGAYSLFSSRDVGKSNMIVSPEGQRPTHGKCPAVTSPWGQAWLTTVRDFYEETGFDQFENDGPYPGDVDVTARPPFQAGEQDSRWVQWRQTTQLYRDLRQRGVYINAPDYYYLNGSNKCGMGYREVNWSLPRSHQPIHTRQNIFDGTWTKTPSMGWMFVPLSQYHGGGEAATIEPLEQHLDHYQRMLMSNLSMGVQAHYRGPRLFDSDRTREMVSQSVAWFKKYRAILESDLVHGRRANGRDLDWMLHVNPRLSEKGMLCVFNPTQVAKTETLRVNLYYTGLTDQAMISKEDKRVSTHALARDHSVELTVDVPAGGMVWYVIR